MLALNELTVIRDGQPLFAPISVTIRPGEVLTCMGASGLGKTSLLHALVSAMPGLSLSGQVQLDGETRPTQCPLLGLTQTVFQDPVLFPHLSVGANVALGITNQPRDRQRQQVNDMLAAVGLNGLSASDPMALSRGQRMRIAVARALVAKPRILLLDEPFSALDVLAREQVKTLVFETVAQQRMIALLVTHQDDDRPNDGETVCLMPYLSAN